PHHEDERRFVYDDAPRYAAALGGEGGGKSVAGIIKGLERLRRGMSGIMVSPDLPHFKRSLWPEFKRWCPWGEVLASHQYRGSFDWEPSQPFMLPFRNGATLLCGGIESPGSWEGPNVSWWLFDEARKHRDAQALKVLDGRARIAGPNGEPPQGIITTTPRMHWLYDYFGPLQEDDEFAAFKADSLVIRLLTADNEANLSEGFVEQRRQSLTEAEARVLLEAGWEDIDSADRFLPTMVLWDACREELPTLGQREPMVLAADAGVSSDCFGVVGVTRHPARHEDVAIRYVRKWEPKKGQALDFDAIQAEIERLFAAFNVIQFAYDPYQLHQMGSGFMQRGLVWASQFSQGGERLESDRGLLDLIQQRRIAHDGNADLRQHIDNADRKTDGDERRLRIVKRLSSKKIDLAVCAAMAAKRCLDLNL
ncbi:MAG: terminase family protein, partial [Anaerolineales bacterium]|nr:terminase family protein [Anaerolineales bacterium]